VLGFARENPRSGDQRIASEIRRLVVKVSARTVRKILREEGIGRTGRIAVYSKGSMEHLWSRADATTGTGRQVAPPRNPCVYLRSLANRCSQLRPPLW
jgi:hypothetical protein